MRRCWKSKGDNQLPFRAIGKGAFKETLDGALDTPNVYRCTNIGKRKSCVNHIVELSRFPKYRHICTVTRFNNE